ncbi:hypothetical protein LAZ40_15770 [Cereibacter sphaeroides]|uniref:hypothetical protein n=1 Tax=Cereibacter sphaeroides TaxID=1063 RepID=UPI001F44C600|nr:hypothetical protein [Cereibacter sphaeroides]MCE6960483.1 hypothetical protein [Cereibacter sphaeroides]MCE6975491.1 hypothetical protein [Cereibacter sphaeroides]
MRADLTLLRRAALVLALVGPAFGQGAAPLPQDLEALNYYVSSGDTAAAEAELRRLRAQFPEWEVPSDLTTLGQRSPAEEIDRIYRLIADGELAEARRTMEETTRIFPGWVPPAEMVQLLDTAEAQAAFDSAAASGDAALAVEIARRSPQILRCDRVNNAWRLAEMQVALGQTAAAVQSYRGVITSCTGLPEISATLEKADAVASDAELADLFRLASGQLPGAGPALKALETRLRSGRGAAPAVATDLPAAGRPRTAGTAAAAASPRVGGGSGSSAVRAAAARGDWTRCAALTAGATSAEVLYERAWCVYNLDRPLEALWAFEPAASGRLGGQVARDARFGKALAFLALQMTEEAARIAAATDLTDQQRVEVEAIILDQRGVRSYRLKEYRRAIAYFDAYEDLTGGLRRDLALLRAYAWLNIGKRAEAKRLFTELNDQLATPETRAGLAASR